MFKTKQKQKNRILIEQQKRLSIYFSFLVLLLKRHWSFVGVQLILFTRSYAFVNVKYELRSRFNNGRNILNVQTNADYRVSVLWFLTHLFSTFQNTQIKTKATQTQLRFFQKIKASNL